MLRRIKIERFKSLRSVELELPRLAIVIGPNAAGKSNFLDALQALSRVATQRTLADALQEPIRGFPVENFSMPSGGLSALLEQEQATFRIEADLDLKAEPRQRTRYAVEVAIDPDAGALSVVDELLVDLSRDWTPKRLARVERSGDDLLIRRRGQPGRPSHEPLRANHTKLSDERLSGSLYELFDSTRDAFRGWRTYYLDPRKAMREAVPPREIYDIGVFGEHLAPFLHGLSSRRPAEYRSIIRSLRSVIPSIDAVNIDLDPARSTLDIQVQQSGTSFSSRILSEGTLRVLALCAVAVAGPREGLLCFEEPENGVHPQRIERIAELLVSVVDRGGPQVIITTHSPRFAGAMLARQQAGAGGIGLFACGRQGAETVIRALPDPGPLLNSPDIDHLLADPDEGALIGAMMQRGWIDG